MKHIGLLCLLVFLVLSIHSVSAARLFQSADEPAAALSGIYKANALSRKVSRGGISRDDPWQLMGMEECKNGDEECEKRRLLSEAHLDYIYTQGHHKP